jgi:hypothetical protein
MSWEMVSVGALNLDTFFFQAMAWLGLFLSNWIFEVTVQLMYSFMLMVT